MYTKISNIILLDKPYGTYIFIFHPYEKYFSEKITHLSFNLNRLSMMWKASKTDFPEGLPSQAIEQS